MLTVSWPIGFSRGGLAKAPSLKSHNKYIALPVQTIPNTMKGASPKQSVASNNKKTCLISHFKLMVRKIILARRFINRCLSIKPEVFFVWTLRPKQELMVNVGLHTKDTGHMYDEKALLDCGATEQFMDKKFAIGNNIAMRQLPAPIRVYNVDGTLNIGGSITHEATLTMIHKGHKEDVALKVLYLIAHFRDL